MKIKDIKLAIKKSKPIKPYYGTQDTDEYWYCPTCTLVTSVIHRNAKGKVSYKTNNYCSCCGQRLDWNVENI